MTDKILEINNLKMGYMRDDILRGLSFSIMKGKITGIIGPNGSGKSTLVKVLGGALKEFEGDILYCGENIKKISANKYAKNVTVVPQENEVIFDYTVREIVSLGRYPYLSFLGTMKLEDKKQIDHVFDITGLSAISEKSINSLSGGEKQLVFIARALCQDTSVLILDEPFTYLDIKHKKIILDILSKFNRDKNLTIVIVMHDININCDFCDYTIMLKNGTIQYSGSTDDIVNEKTLREVFETQVKIDNLEGKKFLRFI